MTYIKPFIFPLRTQTNIMFLIMIETCQWNFVSWKLKKVSLEKWNKIFILKFIVGSYCYRFFIGLLALIMIIILMLASLVAQAVKDLLGNSGDQGLMPRLGRLPRESNGYPFHYFCLENSMDRGAWQAIVHGISKRVGHDWVTNIYIDVIMYIREKFIKTCKLRWTLLGSQQLG